VGIAPQKKDKRETNIEESIPSKNDVNKHIHFLFVRVTICNNYKNCLLQSKAVTTPTCQHVERWSVKKSLEYLKVGIFRGTPPIPMDYPLVICYCLRHRTWLTWPSRKFVDLPSYKMVDLSIVM